MFKKAIVTGCSGFIGSNLLVYLSSLGYSVLGIDQKCPERFTKQSKKFQVQVCNILDLDSLKKTFQQFNPDVVFHLAARTDLDEKNDIQGYASNILGVENLILAIIETSSIQRCIFTSSQLVCQVGYIPSHDQEYCPNTLYGESKVLTEKIVRQYDGGQVEWCLVRPTTVWGPGMSPHYQKFLKMIQKGQYFHIGNAALYKSYSYIGNITYQYHKLMEAPAHKIHRKTFYLADYEAISLRSWTNLIQYELGAKPIPSYPKTFVKLAAKLGDGIQLLGFKQIPFNSFRFKNILTEYVFDLSETQEVCGALPYTVEQGVKALVDWLKYEKIV